MNSNFFGEATLPIGAISDSLLVSFMAFAVYATIPYHPPSLGIHIGVDEKAL
jgi:hypothetical protein